VTLDVDAIPLQEFETTPRIVANFLRVLDGASEDARGFRIRTIDGHIHFAASRVLPVDFDELVGRVDVSAGIRMMNDYLGGSWAVLAADESGRAVRQVERNLYLPQPNWVAAVGGEPIDVEKVERLVYTADRHELWWRTIRSPNSSAESDDGLMSFLRTPANQVEVKIFARQRFRLPTGVAALGVERWPTIHRELVSDAYSRFFEGTLSNLRAAFEGRDYRIGRDPRPGSGGDVGELRAVLSGAFALIARSLGWAPAGGVTPLPGGVAQTEPLFVDELGFTHFSGQQAPAFVEGTGAGAASSDSPLTPGLFVTELLRAVGRDLASAGDAGMEALRQSGQGTDPERDWAAAHLSGQTPPTEPWG
jgi:hypothetical protein